MNNQFFFPKTLARWNRDNWWWLLGCLPVWLLLLAGSAWVSQFVGPRYSAARVDFQGATAGASAVALHLLLWGRVLLGMLHLGTSNPNNPPTEVAKGGAVVWLTALVAFQLFCIWVTLNLANTDLNTH